MLHRSAATARRDYESRGDTVGYTALAMLAGGPWIVLGVLLF